MHFPEPMTPLIVIIGPTAVGKTEIAIHLAEQLNGEIVSADSHLLYRGMDIGTAKPSPSELQRVPHHLIDVADPDDTWSLALYQQKARQAIADIQGRQRLAFLVGGTGQYVRAITQGWQVPEVAPDERLRSILEAWAAQIGKDGLHARLAMLDPLAAANIDARNLRRTVRALEVIFSTGQRFSDQRRAGLPAFELITIGLSRPRTELFARIDSRVDAMLASGLVEEVQRLLDRGYSSMLPSLSAIGYREIIAYLQNQITLDEAVVLIRRNTRILVRRQANWFKPADPEINWFDVHQDVSNRLLEFIRDRLALNP